MEKGGEASGALDATLVSSVAGERGPAAAEPARVQLGEPVAAARAADADRHLVVDQHPATPHQNGGGAGQTPGGLLATAGGESPDAAPVRHDAPADLGAPGADRLRDDGGGRPFF